MNIDRPMVSLFFEIKRNAPYELRDNMKIAAPDVGENLISIYRNTNNQALKTLIETFMQRAGKQWLEKLDKSNKTKLLFKRNQATDQSHAA